MRTRKLVESTVIVTILTAFGSVTDIFKDIAIATKFGATDVSDAYFVAMTIPIILSNVFLNAFRFGFVPIFTEILLKQRNQVLCEIASTIINICFIFLIILCAIGIVASSPIIEVIAPGFNTETSQLCSKLFAFLLPYFVFVAFFALISSVLYTYQHFTFPASYRLFQNLAIIASILFLSQRYGIWRLAIGTLAGVVIPLIPAMLILWRRGFKYRYSMNLRNQTVREAFSLTLIPIGSESIRRSSKIVERFIASTMQKGAISVLTYSHRLMFGISTLLTTGIKITMLPNLSEYAAKNDFEKIREYTHICIKSVVFVTIPIFVSLFFMGEPLIKILFGRGEFDNTAVINTTLALKYYVLALPFVALLPMLVNPFYALKMPQTMFIHMILMLVINVVLYIFLGKLFSFIGIALAVSLTYMISATRLYMLLRKQIGTLDERNLLVFCLKIVASAIIMGGVIFIIISYLNRANISEPIASLIQVCLSSILGLGTFIVAAFFLKVKELYLVMDLIKTKLKG